VARLPDGVVLAGPVEGLDDARILGPCILGHATRGDAGPLVLGAGVTIRSYAVLYRGAVLGADVHVGHGALVREGNVVGAGASIGSAAHLEPGNTIGARSRIHTGGFLSNSIVGDDVFVGPHVVFTDDPHPPCPRYLDCVRGARIGDRAVIGARTVLLPGVEVGAGALVGAGSVVTRDVGAGRVAAGNPARDVGGRAALSCGAGHFARAYAWEDGDDADDPDGDDLDLTAATPTLVALPRGVR
jgi:acetyltransferase-like isoleucine patch superfamily enzyme